MKSPRLVRTVLALYPRRVRERYGDELADLLAGSDHPMRDLADVARCALADRVSESIRSRPTMSSYRMPVLTLVKLLIAPIAFGVGMLTLIMVIMLSGLMERLPDEATMAVLSSAVLPMTLIVLWLGRSMGRTERIAYPVVVVPVAMALGIIGFASIPDPAPGQVLGERFSGTVATTLLWCVGLIGLMALVRTLAGHRARVWMVGVIGGFSLLELSTMAYLFVAASPAEAPRQDALTWYPLIISGLEPALMLSDLMKGLPAVLTMSTFFALSLAAASARRSAPADVPAAVVSPAGT